MSERPSRPPYLDNSALRRLRENFSQEGVLMIERNVTSVLGSDLVSAFTVENPHSPTKKPRNPFERMYHSAHSLVGVAALLGWKENTPALRVLSTQLFLSAEEGMRKDGLIVDNREKLLKEVDRKLTQYKQKTQISDQEEQQIQLLMGYFALRARKNTLNQYLTNGDIDGFWRSLQARVKGLRPFKRV